VLRGDTQRDAGIADLPLGANETLGECGLRHDERARNLGCREAADQAERQCDLCLRGEARVAAREDQLEALVRNRGLLVDGKMLRARQ